MLIAYNPSWRLACSTCEHVDHQPWSSPHHKLVGMSWHCGAPRGGKQYPKGDERACSHMRAPGMPCGPTAALRKAVTA